MSLTDPNGTHLQLEYVSLNTRDLLLGRNVDVQIVSSGDQTIRQIVAAELLAANSEGEPEIKQRARQLFIEHGYLDEALRHLRDAKAVHERVAAARTLGEFGSDLAKQHLIAALFDNESEVRDAAAAALAQINQPSITQNPDNSVAPAVAEPISKELPSVSSEATPNSFPDQPELSDAVPAHYAQADELERLLLDEIALRKILDETEGRLLELTAALDDSRKEFQLIADRAVSFKTEAAELKHQEEDLHERALAATSRYESELKKKAIAQEELERLSAALSNVRGEAGRLSEAVLKVTRKRAELAAVRRSEAENARRIADEHYKIAIIQLKSEEAALRAAAEKAGARRAEVQRARRAIEEQSEGLLYQHSDLMSLPEASHLSELERLRREMEDRHKAEQEQLALEIEKLNVATQQVAARRASIAIATREAETEGLKLAEAEARMAAAEQTRERAKAERLELEARILQSVDREQQLLEAARAQIEANDSFVDPSHLHQEQQQQLEDFAEFRTQQELEQEKRTALEQQIRLEIERMAEAEAEARRRIENAELRRRAAEETCRQAEERAQKVEIEAHQRVVEERQALAKLEAAMRDAAADAETRKDQENRIREEIKELRNLEEETRQQIEEQSLHRADAEVRLQRERERLRVEESKGLKVEREYRLLTEPVGSERTEEWVDDPSENLRRLEPLVINEQPEPSATEATEGVLNERSDIPEALAAALRSAESAERVKALGELVQFATEQARSLIGQAFDDESEDVRNAAALALNKMETTGQAESFKRTFEEANEERRRRIGAAIAASGLAQESINKLSSSDRDETYNALCLLFLMAQTGEVGPLVTTIEEHKDIEVRRAAIRLLTLNGQSEIADAAVKRRRK